MGLRQHLEGASLVVASHRGPGGPGGVAAALQPLVAAAGGTWIAADGCAGPWRLVRVPLSPEEEAGYYRGYANGGLWPLMHGFVERAEFRDEHWRLYVGVNARFARLAADVAPPAAIVWVHDYQLALVPRMLRHLRPDVRIGLFWHIPWPAPEIFGLCPHGSAILDGMGGADLIGFHAAAYARNFRLAFRSSRREARVGVFPLGVDFHRLNQLAQSPATERRMRRLSRLWGLEGKVLAVGVDRLDYTKGILQRLNALRLFLERYPAWRGRLLFVQVAPPTRTEIPAYRDLQEAVRKAAAPLEEQGVLRLIARRLRTEVLVALYRLADMVLVSSLADGMNLVAKEFVASRVDGDGVLILSRGAGAAAEMQEALLVSPLHPDGLVEAMRQAVEMPPRERRRRMAALRARVAAHDAFRWAAEFLEALKGRGHPEPVGALPGQPIHRR